MARNKCIIIIIIVVWVERESCIMRVEKESFVIWIDMKGKFCYTGRKGQA